MLPWTTCGAGESLAEPAVGADRPSEQAGSEMGRELVHVLCGGDPPAAVGARWGGVHLCVPGPQARVKDHHSQDGGRGARGYMWALTLPRMRVFGVGAEAGWGELSSYPRARRQEEGESKTRKDQVPLSVVSGPGTCGGGGGRVERWLPVSQPLVWGSPLPRCRPLTWH